MRAYLRRFRVGPGHLAVGLGAAAGVAVPRTCAGIERAASLRLPGRPAWAGSVWARVACFTQDPCP